VKGIFKVQPEPLFHNSGKPMPHQSGLIATDINAYLAQHERKELLRFLTCGNVDEGKSTLLGRLDVNSLEHHDAAELKVNEIGCLHRDGQCADSVRSLPTQPYHGLVHCYRPSDQCHRWRGHDHRGCRYRRLVVGFRR
jgi:hypothetical protein